MSLSIGESCTCSLNSVARSVYVLRLFHSYALQDQDVQTVPQVAV